MRVVTIVLFDLFCRPFDVAAFAMCFSRYACGMNSVLYVSELWTKKVHQTCRGRHAIGVSLFHGEEDL